MGAKRWMLVYSDRTLREILEAKPQSPEAKERDGFSVHTR
jgi:hypothetical protein